jgi:hypothetical protein
VLSPLRLVWPFASRVTSHFRPFAAVRGKAKRCAQLLSMRAPRRPATTGGSSHG